MFKKRTKEMPIYKIIKISLLKTGKYQRGVNMTRVRKYAKKFDWDIFGMPLVSLRAGDYYVIDGQHRIELLKLMGIEEVMCQVVCGLTYEEEAQKFVKLNSERGALTSNQKFHGRVESKDAIALDIVKIMEENGFNYTKNTGCQKDNYITAVACIEQIYKRRGGNGLSRILSIMRNAWSGVESSLKEDYFKGIETFLAENKSVKDDILCDALEKIVPGNLRLKALVYAGTNTTGRKEIYIYVAKVIRDEYKEYKKYLKKNV